MLKTSPTTAKSLGAFEEVSTNEIFTLWNTQPASFLRPRRDYVGTEVEAGRPEVLAFDEDGYLVPDPAEIFHAMRRASDKSEAPLHASRQSSAILQYILDHQNAVNLRGAVEEERYLQLEGRGGLGKSYTVEWLFAKLGIPSVIEKIPETSSEAQKMLFGESSFPNPYRNNGDRVGSTVETAKAVYAGRGLVNPSTLRFLTARDKGQEEQQIAAQRLYLALHPNGWAKTDPEKYNAFWLKVAEIEGISSDRPFIPRLGLFERCARNGIVLFLDEINRIPKAIKNQLMRALESKKDLELSDGRVIRSTRKLGMIIAAMNGCRAGYGVEQTDHAVARRGKTKHVPDIDVDDAREYLVYLLSGQTDAATSRLQLVQEQEISRTTAICHPEYLDLRIPGTTDQPKLDCLKALAEVHLHMDKQIQQVEEGSGWLKGERMALRDPLPSGPTLLKSFITRATQLIGTSEGLINAVEKLTQTFEEEYIEPLLQKGVPRSTLESQVGFGNFGSPHAPVRLSDQDLTELASCFSPLIPADAQSIKEKTGRLELRDKTIMPMVSKANEHVCCQLHVHESGVKAEPYDFPYPLNPNRGQAEISLKFAESLRILSDIKWDNNVSSH
jgi:hypothetical protein